MSSSSSWLRGLPVVVDSFQTSSRAGGTVVVEGKSGYMDPRDPVATTEV